MASATVGILRVLLTANRAEFETDLNKVSHAVKDTAKTLQGLDKAGMNIGMRMQSLGKGLTTALTLPLAALGAGSAKFAMDFESSFAGVRKTVNATEAEFAQLAQGFRNLSKEIPINVNELNKIGEAAGQLGIETDAILGFSEVMAKLGVTTNLTSDQAATALARLANITKMPQSEFERLGSTVVGLGNNFATTEAEIVDFGLRIAGAGKQAGISEAGILAIGTAMSSVGVQAEAGGTAVQKVLIEMVKASAQGAEGFTTFAKAAGMSAQEFATLFEKDAATAFRLFVEGLGREGKNAINILAELGLEDQRLIRSFLALSGAGDLLERTLNEANTAWRENTALSEEARKRFETTESKLTLLWNRIKDVGITIGNALIPALQLAIDGTDKLLPIIERLGKGFADLPKAVQLVVVGIGVMAAAAGPLVFVLGQLVMAAGSLSRLLSFGLNPALATTAGHHHKAATAATANATATTAAGVAATGASSAFKLLATQALAAFVVFESFPRILQAAGIALDIFREKSERDKGEAAEQARRYQIRAEASKIAGRAILDHAEAVEILTNAGRDLADFQSGEIVYLKAAGPAYEETAKAVKLTAEELKALALKASEAAKAGRTLWNEIGEAQMRFTREQMDAAERLTTEVARMHRDLANEVGLLWMEMDRVMMQAVKPDWLGGMFVEFKQTVEQSKPVIQSAMAKLGESIKGSLGQVLNKIPQTIADGFIHGNIGGAVKSIVSQVGAAIGGSIGAMFGPLGQKIGAAVGSMAGLLTNPFKKLFGIGINEEVKKANAEIEKLRQGLLTTHGTLEQLEAKANRVGLSFRDNWGHQGQAGLKAFNDLMQEFERRMAAAEQSAGDLFSEIMNFAGEQGGVPNAMRGMIARFIELGFLTDEQVAKLQGLGDSGAVNIQKMEAATALFNGRIDQMGKAFQQSKINETAKKYADAIEDLTAGGAEMGAVLFDAKEELSELAAESLRNKTTLPANLQPWIEELHRTGQLLDPITGELVDISQIEYGEAMKTQAEITNTWLEKILEMFQQLIDKISGTERALDRLPDEKTIRINYTEGDWPGDPSRGPRNEGFAQGTMGAFGRWFGQFSPRGTPTRLHNTEAVITPPQAVPFAMDVMRSMLPSMSAPTLEPAWASSAAGGVNVIVINGQGMRPDQLRDEIMRNLGSSVAKNEHGVRVALTNILRGKS
jgi:TP901 family phage tail tape measure protein